MTNENCLEGIRCPKCGNESRFFIAATITAEVTDDGADLAGHTDIEWDDTSWTRCPECDHSGVLAGFYTRDTGIGDGDDEHGVIAGTCESR